MVTRAWHPQDTVVNIGSLGRSVAEVAGSVRRHQSILINPAATADGCFREIFGSLVSLGHRQFIFRNGA
jgi:hypothetical protein